MNKSIKIIVTLID